MKRLLISLFCTLLVAGCFSRTNIPIGDLSNLPQDAGAFNDLVPDTRLISQPEQDAAYHRFLAAHFGPWDQSEPVHSAEDVFWGIRVYGPKKIYGENTLPRSPGWMLRMEQLSCMDSYPSMSRRAIAVTNTSMRVLPTLRPAFYDFAEAGEGFPFDYMQNSLVLAGTPLYASHMSADGAWVMVESRFAFGWVPVTDIGWVDEDFAKTFRSGLYGAVIQDEVPVAKLDGSYQFTANVGTILPYAPARPGSRRIYFHIPVRDRNGNAVLATAALRPEVVDVMPIPATPANFSMIINNMLGRQYGWGGLYQDRDCSSSTMDLMAGFGIYLPRNSSQQVKVGQLFSLEGMDRDEKKKSIISQSTPFLTLIRKPGHIMLYIGQRNGEPVVFHSVWGLKTKTNGKLGRKIIGGAVITTLEPGLEQPDLARPDGILLETVYSASNLPGITEK
ncbi:SH3 domain-containing protein [Maridesulfovibrio sp.]|uniref:SH3 domain-containing protein n=1 Tax=Maridesulfovibrio sp. TaxID=2795000 RepID=UPI002A187C74|nr:NlpC/P60 family N-terminal domain-containing protein [Maridesulfovibrio sp.]